MPSTGFYLFLRYPLGSLDFTGFRDLILQVINRIFCKLAFSQYFLCSFLNTKSYRYFYYTLKNIVLSMKKQQVFYYFPEFRLIFFNLSCKLFPRLPPFFVLFFFFGKPLFKVLDFCELAVFMLFVLVTFFCKS